MTTFGERGRSTGGFTREPVNPCVKAMDFALQTREPLIDTGDY